MTHTQEQQTHNRVHKINELVDTEARSLLNDIAIASSDIDSLIDLLKDRVIQSTDIANTIALSRLFEIKVDLYKKRTDVLKALLSDKSIDVNSVKKALPDYSSLESILGGAAGAMAVLSANNTRVNPNTPYIDTSNIEIIDASSIITEVETVDLTPRDTKDVDIVSGVERLLNE